MELGLNRLPWYGQIATFVLVSLAGLLVFHVFWAAPRREGIAVRELALNQKRVEVGRARHTASRLPEVRAALGETETHLDGLSVALPGEKDAGALLRQLQDLAAQTNLSIRGFTPQAASTQELYSAWPSRLELVGTYHNLGFFLDRVSKFPQVIRIEDIEIRTIDPPRVNATITATCTAMTFVLNAAPADDGRGGDDGDDGEEVDPEV